jgi:hypothetical protein
MNGAQNGEEGDTSPIFNSLWKGPCMDDGILFAWLNCQVDFKFFFSSSNIFDQFTKFRLLSLQLHIAKLQTPHH